MLLENGRTSGTAGCHSQGRQPSWLVVVPRTCPVELPVTGYQAAGGVFWGLAVAMVGTFLVVFAAWRTGRLRPAIRLSLAEAPSLNA
jgi:hypothetical protein